MIILAIHMCICVSVKVQVRKMEPIKSEAVMTRRTIEAIRLVTTLCLGTEVVAHVTLSQRVCEACHITDAQV